MTFRALSALAIVTIVACGGGESRTGDSTGAVRPAGSSSVDLNGAGATFPYPLYSKWFSDYATATSIKINYQSIGSGGGIKQL